MSIVDRRTILSTGTAGLAAMVTGLPAGEPQGKVVAKARIKQSVCRWCYAKIPLPDLCRAAADLGLTAIDLLQPKEWDTARQYGLTCSMGSGFAGTIPNGLNNPGASRRDRERAGAIHPASRRSRASPTSSRSSETSSQA